MTLTTYEIIMTDSEAPSDWMGAGHIQWLRPYNQDSGQCCWTVVTSDASVLEAAFAADPLVLEYTHHDEAPPFVTLAFGDPEPSTVSDTEGAIDYDVTLAINGIVVTGRITLWRDRANYDRMSPCGAPLDGWVSHALLAAMHALSPAEARGLADRLAYRSSGSFQLGAP